uniref:Baseplate hub subunit n=1 Tax=Pseudomonas phage Cygsa01 TaxID=3138529 RepID=A0AAU6W4I6_9VIRU
MGLPILPKATFPYKNPWLKTGFKMSPFDCGQESILVQVKDAEGRADKLNAIKQVLEECTGGTTDPGALPLFTVEDMFVRLREKSGGETLALTYVCSNEVQLPEGEDGALVSRECKTPVNITIQLKDIQLVQEGEHTLVFPISEDIGVKMRYPTLDGTLEYGDDPGQVVMSCIESVYDSDTVYPAADQTKEELERFYKSIPLKVKNEIREKFFNTMPHLHYVIKAKCSKCGYMHEQQVESLNSIFT